MGSLSKRTVLVLSLAAVMVMAIVGTAFAGHTNSVLESALNGRNEVSSDATNGGLVGDPNGRGEVYVFGIDGDPTTLCYVLFVDKIDTATAAYIHRGEAGTNGPVVASLAAPGDGNAADCLTEGEPGKFADGQTVSEILGDPSSFYVNVHNDSYPGGAIRGQLAPQH